MVDLKKVFVSEILILKMISIKLLC